MTQHKLAFCKKKVFIDRLPLRTTILFQISFCTGISSQAETSFVLLLTLMLIQFLEERLFCSRHLFFADRMQGMRAIDPKNVLKQKHA